MACGIWILAVLCLLVSLLPLLHLRSHALTSHTQVSLRMPTLRDQQSLFLPLPEITDPSHVACSCFSPCLRTHLRQSSWSIAYWILFHCEDIVYWGPQWASEAGSMSPLRSKPPPLTLQPGPGRCLKDGPSTWFLKALFSDVNTVGLVSNFSFLNYSHIMRLVLNIISFFKFVFNFSLAKYDCFYLWGIMWYKKVMCNK